MIRRVAAIVVLLAVPFASAAINFEKSRELGRAPNFWYHPIERSDTRILAFDERQGVVIPTGMIEVQRLNRWDDIAALDRISTGGAPVDSHMVYLKRATRGPGRVTASAEIEFDAPILGFVADDRLFAATNPLFAPAPTHNAAPGPDRWSLEEKQGSIPLDLVTVLTPTRIRVDWTNESATDALRVFTARLPAAAPGPVRLLFAGSSSTYWNDLPREVARAVDGRMPFRPGAAVVPAVVGRSGSDIRVYLEPGFDRYEYGVQPGQTFLGKLAAERNEFVVLMTVARFIMGDDDPSGTDQAHADAVTRYCDAIRSAGGEPVFYEMGWGRNEREAEGRARIFDLAVRNRVRLFAPCSSAWARVHRERPDLALQHPQDNSHPGDAGHFLNVACFYAALTGRPPAGALPRTYPVWPHALPKPATDEARAAEADRIAAFKPDAYQATLAKWMHRHTSMNLVATLDDATASYLERVAWETWADVDGRLRRATRR